MPSCTCCLRSTLPSELSAASSTLMTWASSCPRPATAHRHHLRRHETARAVLHAVTDASQLMSNPPDFCENLSSRADSRSSAPSTLLHQPQRWDSHERAASTEQHTRLSCYPLLHGSDELVRVVTSYALDLHPIFRHAALSHPGKRNTRAEQTHSGQVCGFYWP